MILNIKDFTNVVKEIPLVECYTHKLDLCVDVMKNELYYMVRERRNQQGDSYFLGWKYKTLEEAIQAFNKDKEENE